MSTRSRIEYHLNNPNTVGLRGNDPKPRANKYEFIIIFAVLMLRYIFRSVSELSYSFLLRIIQIEVLDHILKIKVTATSNASSLAWLPQM